MKTIVRSVGAAALLLLAVSPAPARSLREQLGSASELVGISGGAAFDALADVIADTAARNLPVVSASAGITYGFNRELEIFERTSQTLGPIFLERPDTIGRSKFNVNVSFQYVNFNAYDGADLGSLQSPYPIVTRVTDGSGNLLGYTANRLVYDMQITSYVTAISATYGLLDSLDLNLLLPLIQTHLGVAPTSQQLFIAEPTGPFLPSQGDLLSGDTSGGKFGVGDILLRLKYQLPQWRGFRSAAGLQLRLPSGEQENFQGTGSFEASPAVYVSTLLWGRVAPQFNAAIDLNAEDVSRSQARYGLGVDVDVVPRFGLAFAFLGRSEFARSDTPGSTSFLHLVNGTTVQEPLLGLNFGRKDFFDFSFGFRAVVWRQVMLFASGIYALNNEGLRNDTIIPTVGVEGTF